MRERIEDIAILARHLLQRLTNDLGCGEVSLAPDAERALQLHPWPGNIREMRNVLERALLLNDRKMLSSKNLRFDAPGISETGAIDTRLTLQEIERRHIEQVLKEEQGQVESAARRLGIPRSTLYQKIKQHRIGASKV